MVADMSTLAEVLAVHFEEARFVANAHMDCCEKCEILEEEHTLISVAVQ